jgi:PPOX class probable F420-dependent enzyme
MFGSPMAISTSQAPSLAYPDLALTLERLPGWAREMLEDARVGHLAFVDEQDRPRVLPVTYAVAEGAVWSVIDDKPKQSTEPARVRYLRRRPEAGLCVDLYDDDWSQLAWVQLGGTVEVLGLGEGAAGLTALIAKYAPYRERRPPGPLLRLAVARATCWRA